MIESWFSPGNLLYRNIKEIYNFVQEIHSLVSMFIYCSKKMSILYLNRTSGKHWLFLYMIMDWSVINKAEKQRHVLKKKVTVFKQTTFPWSMTVSSKPSAHNYIFKYPRSAFFNEVILNIKQHIWVLLNNERKHLQRKFPQVTHIIPSCWNRVPSV